MKNKSETFEKFKIFKALVEKQSGSNIKVLRQIGVVNLPLMNLMSFVRKMVFIGNYQHRAHQSKTEWLNGKIELWLKWLEA